MSEKEFEHLQKILIEAIKRKMKPIYWMVGVALGLIGITAGPLYPVIINMAMEQTILKKDIEKCVPEEEAYKNFLPKEQYHILQKREHDSDREAISNPSQSEYIYMKHNMNEAESLGIFYRGEHK